MWAAADSLFVLTHDPVRRAHSLWRLAPAAAAEESAALAPFDDITKAAGINLPGTGAGDGAGEGVVDMSSAGTD